MYKADAQNDAAAMAACYTLGAILVTPQGPFYGRGAIQNWYVDRFEQGHHYIAKVDRDSFRLIGTAGDGVWLNEELSETIQDPNCGLIEVSKGYWSSTYQREAGTLKTRFDIFNVTPAPAPTPSPTASRSNQ